MREQFSSALTQSNPAIGGGRQRSNEHKIRIIELNDRAYNIRSKEPEESLKLAKQALELAVHQEDLHGTCEARLNIGFYHMYRGAHRQALELFSEVLFKAEKLDSPKITARTHYNLAVLHARIAEYEEAIEYLQKAFHAYESAEDELGVAKCHFQFASIRFGLREFNDAMTSARLSLDLETKIGDQNAMAAVLTLIGRIHLKLSEKEQAIKAFQESKAIRKLTNDKVGLASCLYYEIEFFVELEDFVGARRHIEEARQHFSGINFPMGQTLFVQLEARCLVGEGKKRAAISKHEETINEAQRFNLKSLAVDSFREIAKLYEDLGEADMALKYYKWYVHSKEEMMSHKSRIQLDNIKLHRELNNAKKIAQLERFKQEEMSQASATISKMHQEFKSSLTYAKRIQDAIMPSAEHRREMLAENFLINRPKEIVSGDFLFLQQEEETKYIAVADCTGHGIPGCILSVYATNALQAAISRDGMSEPEAILDQVRTFFINDFMSEKVTLKDGMDIALIKIEGSSLTFSGAYRSIYIRRGKELIELKGDRQPVGLFLNMNNFQSVEFDLQEGDQIIMFSDGITDQMGGEKMKKLKAPLFKKWLIEVSELSLEAQKEELLSRLKHWQGALSQTDDMMIFSFTHHEKSSS